MIGYRWFGLTEKSQCVSFEFVKNNLLPYFSRLLSVQYLMNHALIKKRERDETVSK